MSKALRLRENCVEHMVYDSPFYAKFIIKYSCFW